ncbi:hypothetical protein AB4Z21_37225, partial [Paenibacillus sp. MCAF20]
MIKKLILSIIIIVIGIILIEGMRVLLNPLTRSEDTIREKLLTQIPLGTDMNEAIDFAKRKKGWSDIKIDDANGYNSELGIKTTVGEKHFSVHAGDYRSLLNLYFFVADVTIYFGFNENSELIDIRVRKDID